MAERYRPDQPTLCWKCKNTNRFDCPWFDPADPQPVPGWVAEPREMYSGSTTYLVKECPKFEPEPPREIAAPPLGENVPGVQRRATSGEWWEARIMRGSKNYSLGCFKTQEQAIAARRAAEEAIARGEEPKRKKPSRKVYQRKAYPPGHCPGVRCDGSTWEARITRKGKMYYLGHFKTEEEAIEARRVAEEAFARGEEPKRKERPAKKPPAEKPPEKKPNDKRAVRGVRRGKRHWTARIRHDGKVYHLGYFKTEEKAIAARLAAEKAIRRGEAPCKNT